MPIQVSCKCGKKLKVKEDLAGKSIRCPGCKQVHRIPAPKAPADVDVFEDESEVRSPKKGKKWRVPSVGMNLVFFGWSSWAAGVALALLAFAQLLIVILAKELVEQLAEHLPFLPFLLDLLWNRIVAVLIIVLAIAGEAASLAGYATCILVPKKTGARMWIALALGLAIFKIAVRVVAYLSKSPDEPVEANRGLMLLGLLLSVGEWVMLLIFLRMIAFDRYATWLMRGITQLIFLSAGAGVCMAGLYLWMLAAAQGAVLADGRQLVYPRALALTGLAFCGLAGYVIFRQILLLQASRALFLEAATGTGRKSIER